MKYGYIYDARNGRVLEVVCNISKEKLQQMWEREYDMVHTFFTTRLHKMLHITPETLVTVK